MSRRLPSFSTRSRRRSPVAKASIAAAVMLALVVGLVVLADMAPGDGSRPGDTIRAVVRRIVPAVRSGDGPAAAPRSGAGGAGDSPADGFIPVGGTISPFDDDLAAIAKLDPELRAALQRAASDARAAGIEIRVSSGWRSAAYQQRLLDQAVGRYGSLQVARRYVNTPDRSTHVRGAAVDVLPTEADSWLQQHGADYGLCQTFAIEMWHYELSTTPGGTCPPQRPDASGG